MKKIVVFIVIISGMLMTGCLVSSLHPFYKAKDIVYDPIMEGAWIDEDSSIWVFRQNVYTESFMGEEKTDNKYEIEYYEEELGKTALKGTLFQLNGEQYFDFCPNGDYEDHFTSDMISFHMVPTHTLARVQFNADSIMIYWYGEDWLNDMLEENRIKIPHETVQLGYGMDRHVLTASTDELQKFIIKYANDPDLVGDIEQIFARGYTNDQDDYGLLLKLKPFKGSIPGDHEAN